MKNSKFTTMPAIALYAMLCLVLSSCKERVKVVETQKIEVKIDTIYYYKIERIEEDKNFYDIEKRTDKLNAGDHIEIMR